MFSRGAGSSSSVGLLFWLCFCLVGLRDINDKSVFIFLPINAHYSLAQQIQIALIPPSALQLAANSIRTQPHNHHDSGSSATPRTMSAAKPRTKVVVRGLPPTLTEDALRSIVDKLAGGAYGWSAFYAGTARCVLCVGLRWRAGLCAEQLLCARPLLSLKRQRRAAAVSSHHSATLHSTPPTPKQRQAPHPRARLL